MVEYSWQNMKSQLSNQIIMQSRILFEKRPLKLFPCLQLGLDNILILMVQSLPFSQQLQQPFYGGPKVPDDPIDVAHQLFIKQKKDFADVCCPNLNPKYYVVRGLCNGMQPCSR